MPERIRTTIYDSSLRQLGTSPAGPIFRRMVTVGAAVETAAKRNASGTMVGVRTGNLRSSIAAGTPEVRGSLLTVTVEASAPYALAVHEGTAPHDIVPTSKRVLAWQGPTGPGFAHRVHHPGTKARPFLRDALPAIR